MFKVIPENFFVPLGSPNKTVYWECIGKLFTVMDNQLAFGVERELLVDELEFYFDQSSSADISEDEFEGGDSRTKANWMLRRLEFYGWIEIETDKSYVQRVAFREYAVKVIRTLTEIEEGKKTEYQGYIYTIYSLIKNRTDNPGIVLMQISDNTDMLITGLKNLNSGIKHYIDELTKHKTVSEIMDVLFNDYIINIVDKAYHRLLTSDNVAKFRPEIVDFLEKKSRNHRYIEQTTMEIAEIKELNREEAEEYVLNCLKYVISSFRNMDEILTEIDRKNTIYQKAAVNRARFLLTGGDDIRGQLRDILSAMAKEISKDSMDLNGIYRIPYIEKMIQVYSTLTIDETSLYSRTEGRKIFKPQEINTPPPDMKIREEKMLSMLKRMEKILSREKIENYVLDVMGERNAMNASEMPIATTEDFVKLIYTRLYGVRKTMKYSVKKSNRHVCMNGFEFEDFEIFKH